MAIIDNFDENLSEPRYPFLTDGDYVLELVAVKTGQNWKDKKEYFKATACILESSGAEALQPGQMVTVKIDEEPQFGFHKKDIRNLVAAIVDEPEAAVNGAVVSGLLGEDNPGKGQKFRARRGLFTDDKGKGKVFRKTAFIGMSGTLPPLATAEQVSAAEAGPPAATKGKGTRR